MPFCPTNGLRNALTGEPGLPYDVCPKKKAAKNARWPRKIGWYDAYSKFIPAGATDPIRVRWRGIHHPNLAVSHRTAAL